MNWKGGFSPTVRERIYLELKEYDGQVISKSVIATILGKIARIPSRKIGRVLNAYFFPDGRETCKVQREVLREQKVFK